MQMKQVLNGRWEQGSGWLVWVCGVLLMLGEVGAVWGGTVIVTRRDGSQITGELVSEDEEAVKLMLPGAGAPIAIPKSGVMQVLDLSGTAADKSKKPKDVVTKPTGDAEKAALLYEKVMRLGVGETKGPVFNEKQISLIRAYEYEMQPGGGAGGVVMVSVPKETVDTLLKVYEKNSKLVAARKEFASEQAFRSQASAKLFGLILEMKARDLYGKVQVRSDAQAVKAFRSRVMPNYVLSYCATIGCHGSEKGGKFRLIRERAMQDDGVYGNYLILQKHKKDLERMVDRDRPEQSLLLQYGLRENLAKSAHPQVEGWKPAFLTDKDVRYQMVLDWIKRDMVKGEAMYPLEEIFELGTQEGEGVKEKGKVLPGGGDGVENGSLKEGR